MKPIDVLIIGQGLAGSALAWRLQEQGLSHAVVDRGHVDAAGRPTASRIAAGLITPITGKRLTLSPAFSRLRESAVAFYRSVEEATGTAMLVEQPSLRVLESADERALFDQRLGAAAFARQVREATPPQLPATLKAGHGAFWMQSAAKLDTAAFLDATRRWLRDRGALIEHDIDPEADIDFAGEFITVPRLGVAARRVCSCQGAEPSSLFKQQDFRLNPAKGEVLTIAAPGLGLRCVVHRGVWVAPLAAASDEYLVGATHTWETLDSNPTTGGREWLLERFATVTGVRPTVLDHAAAVRPATTTREPAAGVCKNQSQIAWLNGLGSKGALFAPSCAAQLATQLATA